MSKMLHLINKSPFDRNALDSCLRLAQAGGSVLLIEFYVLGPDVSARGLDDTPLIDGIDVVDYGGFVDLVVEHDVAQSWL